MKLAKLKTLYLKTQVETTDDIYAELQLLSLVPHETVYTYTSLLPLTELLKGIESFEYVPSNFEIVNSVPKVLPNVEGYEVVENADYLKANETRDNNLTLTRIFNMLQMSGCQFKFEPSMYKDITGEESFENFHPSLEGVYVPFKNLVISSSKFNIVFSVVIQGTADVQGVLVNTSRFYPFKVVKAGVPLFQQLEVHVPEGAPIGNILGKIAEKVSSTVYLLDLTKFQPFSDQYLPTANDIYALNYTIKEKRVELKALKYIKDILASYLQVNGLLTLNDEWYRGDKVMLDTLSDEGLPILEAYISGEKGKKSVETFLDTLGEVGALFRKIVQEVVVSETSEELAGMVEKQFGEFMEIVANDRLEQYYIDMLNTIVKYTIMTGTIKDKWVRIIDDLNQMTLEANSLELKFLNARFGLLTQLPNNVIDYNPYSTEGLGPQKTGRRDSITYIAQTFKDAKVTVKRTYVPSTHGPAKLEDWFNGYFKQSLPETPLREISDDFRKED